MRIVLPHTPSARDHELYRLHLTRAYTQTQLAQQFKISQQRVAQILKNVEGWMGADNHNEDNLTQAEQYSICAQQTRIKYQAHEQWAMKIVEQSLAPQVTITQVLRDNVVQSTEKRSKHGKCDQQIFRQMVDLVARVEMASKAEIDAKALARESRASRLPHREDCEVKNLLRWCRELQRRNREARKAGVDIPPAPRLVARQIEAHIRVRFRQNPDYETAMELLPPQWQEADRRLYPCTAGWGEEVADEMKETAAKETVSEVASDPLLEVDEATGEWKVPLDASVAEKYAGWEKEVACDESAEPPQEAEATDTPTGESALPDLVENYKGPPAQKPPLYRSLGRGWGSGIPADDESYEYTGVGSMDGHIRVLRTCKKTGYREWISPPPEYLLEAQRQREAELAKYGHRPKVTILGVIDRGD